MTFSEAIKEYTDTWGLVHPDQSHSSQNGLTYLAYSLALKSYLGELMRGKNRALFNVAIKTCSKRPGLVCRVPGPEWGYQNSIDDAIGVICGSWLTLSTTGLDVLYFGMNHFLNVGPFKFKYFYNTDCPDSQLDSSGKKNWAAWFGLFPIFRVLVSWGSGFERTPFERFVFAFDCLWSACFAKQSDDTPLMMLFLKLQAFGAYRLKALCTRILNMRKITYKKAFGIYFGEAHPLAKYFPIKNPWGEK